MYQQPPSPQSIGGVIDDAIRLFRSSFSRCWVLAVIPSLILLVYNIFFFRLSVAAVYTATRQIAALQGLLHSPRVLVLDVVSLLLSLVFQGAVLVRELAVARGDESFTIARALGTSLRRLPGMFLGMVLFLLAIAGGAIALVIPAFWLWGRLQLWTAALFIEDVSAPTALGSSWHLTKGHWWRAAAIFSVTIVMILVLTVAFAFLGGLLAALTHVSFTGRTILVSLASTGASAVSYPLGAATLIAMYHDFKLRREGGDLAARVGALSSAT